METTKQIEFKEFNITQLLLYLHESNSYNEESVLIPLREVLALDPNIDYLRIRKTGIDCIKSNGVSFEKMLEKYSTSNIEWIKIIK
jgi:hypothetical protein